MFTYPRITGNCLSILLLTLLFIGQYENVHGQLNTYAWKANELSDKTRFSKQIRFIKQGEYKVAQQNDSLYLITDLGTITHAFRRNKGKLITHRYSDNNFCKEPELISILCRKNIQDQLWRTYHHWKDLPEPPLLPNEKTFKKILKGKLFHRRYSNYAVTINLGPAQSHDHRNEVVFQRGKRPFARLNFAPVQGDFITYIPVLDSANCKPIDRYTYFKKIKGKFLQVQISDPYNPETEIKRTADYTIYFEKNSSKYNPEHINEIVTFLNDSSYSIKGAWIRSYASVEGDSAINMKLMRERSQVFLKALEKANNKSIEKKIETYENWDQFTEQLIELGEDTAITHERWKELFLDDSVSRALEPYLSKQRKAQLKLFLTEKLDSNQQWQRAFHHFDKYYRLFKNINSKKHRKIYINKLLSIKSYLEKEVNSGNIDTLKLCGKIPYYDPWFAIYNFYATLRHAETISSRPCESKEQILLNAFNAINSLIRQNPKESSFLNFAIDIQSFAYEKLLEGDFRADILCSMNYPDRPPFYLLILNQLHFLNYQGRLIYQQAGCSVTGHNQGINDSYVSRRPHAQPDQQPSRYYFFLKKRVMMDDKEIQSLTLRSDEFLYWDLYEFLSVNEKYWKVWDNEYYDKDVDYRVMEKLMRRLLRMENNICPQQLNSLALSLYIKILKHTVAHNDISNEADRALRFITSYYSKNADNLTASQVISISDQLVVVNRVYYNNAPLKYALNLLSTFKDHHPSNKRVDELAMILSAILKENFELSGETNICDLPGFFPALLDIEQRETYCSQCSN